MHQGWSLPFSGMCTDERSGKLEYLRSLLLRSPAINLKAISTDVPELITYNAYSKVLDNGYSTAGSLG
jgi:hypothetical protein